MIEQFLQQRGAAVLPPRELEAIRRYLLGLVANGQQPPHHAGHPDWKLIADICGIDADRLANAGWVLEPGFDAVKRFTAKHQRRERTNSKPSPQSKDHDHRRERGRAKLSRSEKVPPEGLYHLPWKSLPAESEVPNRGRSWNFQFR
jgi:hypothetical protein